jgi:predicted CXXCH cytochrome family protein
MARRSKSRKGKARHSRHSTFGKRAPLHVAAQIAGPPSAVTRQTVLLSAIVVGAILVIGAIGYFAWPSGEKAATAPAANAPAATARAPATNPVSPASYVGAATCGQCHAGELKAWTGSHHQLAMQEATAATVLGDFDNATFRYTDVESTFSKRDGRFVVRTDGPDGTLSDFDVKYVFGVTPLQQYLIEFPGGRYQALSIAWDARPQAEGGQRWFHLYPNEKIDHADALHWTGLYQNWNLQCAACHSTNLRKNFDAASNSYQTTWSEMSVACEACHGPGSQHVEWAKTAKAPYAADDRKALEAYLKSRAGEAWHFPSVTAKYAERDKPAPVETMNVCMACHARRSVLKEGGPASAPLLDAHRLALPIPPLYHADGQQREEVYTWGSFAQSKMFARGVTCMDCHEPHALKLRAEGNALCGRCHNASVFDTKQHHHHDAGTKGAECVGCHMPAQNYMVIDARRDHSFRLPRPDLSSSIGSPNACMQCHADRTPEWAADAIDGWYGRAWRSRLHYGATLHAGMTQGAKGLPDLLKLAADSGQPAIVRAAAATLAQGQPRQGTARDAEKLVADADPSVRIAAIGLADGLERAPRLRLVAPLLSDPIRGVRIEAARTLADVPSAEVPPDRADAMRKALAEYEASLQLDADWPTANMNLGNLRLRQRRFDEAAAAYRRALSLDPRLTGAYVNSADLYRQQGRDADGEGILRQGLQLMPDAAELHHTLGLLLVRKGDRAGGIEQLGEAAKLAPQSARYAYVYAVGLSSTGRRAEALAVLGDADERHPGNLDILASLVSMNREAGDKPAALAAARKLAETVPGDPAIARLISELEKAP